MPRVVIAAACILLIAALSTTRAARGQAGVESLALHAVEIESGSCAISDPCDPGPPMTNVAAGVPVTVYLLARHFDDLIGVETAFEWTTGFTLVSSAWDCQALQVASATPTGPGPTHGTLVTTFDCVEALQTVLIGRLFLMSGLGGRLYLVDPMGSTTGGLDCTGMLVPVPEPNRGVIEVGGPGYDACEPPPPAVESRSWGRIKSRFDR